MGPRSWTERRYVIRPGVDPWLTLGQADKYEHQLSPGPIDLTNSDQECAALTGYTFTHRQINRHLPRLDYFRIIPKPFWPRDGG